MTIVLRTSILAMIISGAISTPLKAARIANVPSLNCAMGCGDCALATVERTIMVPTWTTEMRTVNCTEYRREIRHRVIQVRRAVPVEKEVTEHYTVMVPELRTRTVSCQVRVPVQREVEQEYTVMVPYQETRQGTRYVCQRVTEDVERTVCVDRGHWEERTVDCGACGGCRAGCSWGWRRRCLGTIGGCGWRGGCASGCASSCGTVVQKCWVPNIVREKVTCKVWRNVRVQQPYEYEVTVCRSELRKRTVTVCDYQIEERTKEVPYTVCVPQQRSRTYTVSLCNYVTEPREVSYEVCVPYTVQKQVAVRVCRMVPKTVTVPCGGCGICGGCIAPCGPCGGCSF